MSRCMLFLCRVTPIQVLYIITSIFDILDIGVEGMKGERGNSDLHMSYKIDRSANGERIMA